MRLRIFGLRGSEEYARKVAEHVGPDVALSTHEEEFFDDDEVYLRSAVNVRGADVFVIQSLYSCQRERVADKFLKLLLFVGSLHDASVGRVTVVAPYFAYARQDRKTKSREPISSKYIAKLLEAVRADRLLTCDIHNLVALQNGFFDCIPDNLEAKNLLAQHIARTFKDSLDQLCLMSPDINGVLRTSLLKDKLVQITGLDDIPLGIVHKSRGASREVRVHNVVGDVRGRKVVFVDDVIASGKTMLKGREAVEAAGGEVVAACATHGLFVGRASENLAAFPRIIITDTISPFRLKGPAAERLEVISTARLFAQAIRRIHEEDSISDLLQ